MLGVSRVLVLDGLRDLISRRQALAGVLSMAAFVLTEDVDAKKKKRKKKKSKKDKNKGQGPKSGCPAGKFECDEQCRDLSTDREHCGDCYESCNDGQICSVGVCTVPCSEHACLVSVFSGDFDGYNIAVAPDGNLAIAGGDNQVGLYSPNGQLLQTIGEFGTEVGEFVDPGGIAFGPDGAMYVPDSEDRIQVFKKSGEIEVITTEYTGLLAITATGIIYSKGSSKLHRLSGDGLAVYSWGPDGTDQSYFSYLPDFAVDGSGDIFAVDASACKVYRFGDDGSGNITVKWIVGSAGVDPGEFRYPETLTVANNRVYVGDGKSSSIHVLNAMDGAFLFKFPITDRDGYGLWPDDIAVHSNGSVYIAESGVYVYSLNS